MDINSIELYINNKELKHNIDIILEQLSDVERSIIIYRFAIIGNKKTLKEIGLIYGFSKERVRQLEARALRKLRHPKRANMIRDFKTN